LDTSNITIDAINAVIDAYNKQADAARETKIQAINDEIENTQKTIEQIKLRIQARQSEFQLTKMMQFRELEAAGQKLVKSGAIHDPYAYTDTNVVLAYKQYSEAMDEVGDKYRDLQDEIAITDKQLNAHKATIDELNKMLGELHKKAPETNKFFGDTGEGAGKAGGATKELVNTINKYIETAMRAADVQAMLNNETQRTIDGYKAKIDYHSRDTATAQERAIALQTEAEMMGKLKEKQEGVHKEANYLREALAKLEQRQSTVNVRTDEGWDLTRSWNPRLKALRILLKNWH
jgi:uncharacterized coiled-coil DUF342 family protein